MYTHVQNVRAAEIKRPPILVEPKNKSSALVPVQVHQRQAMSTAAPRQEMLNLTVEGLDVRHPLPAIAQATFERPQFPMMDVQV